MEFDKLLETGPDLIVMYGTQILLAIIIFIVGKWIAGRVANFTKTLMEKSHVDETVAAFVRNLVYIGLLVVVVIAGGDAAFCGGIRFIQH